MNSSPASRQLALSVRLDDDATFENFYVTEANRGPLQLLRDACSKQALILLWGAAATGRTHLLQAACHQAAQQGRESLYIPLAEKQQLDPAILDDVSSLGLVCLDDLQCICGDKDWERALFNAINACAESGSCLLLAADAAAKQLNVDLADLHSRLQQALILQLTALDDEGKLAALRQRARNRGIELSREVGEFIMLRAERSLAALIDVLDALDNSSLEQQRRITIPLVKSTLGW